MPKLFDQALWPFIIYFWLSLFTGLEYWTEVVSFFGQGSMILVYFQIFEETYNNQCI